MISTWEQPKIYSDLNGNELEKHASIYANIDLLVTQQFEGNQMTLLNILENYLERSGAETYFSTVTGLAIPLKQDLTTGVFVKNFPKCSE